MNPETLAILGAYIEAQRSTNMKIIAALIEIVKLFPAGPTREPAIAKLQDLAIESQTTEDVANALFEALSVEAKNAAKP